MIYFVCTGGGLFVASSVSPVNFQFAESDEPLQSRVTTPPSYRPTPSKAHTSGSSTRFFQ
jgi:hypothetical protein